MLSSHDDGTRFSRRLSRLVGIAGVGWIGLIVLAEMFLSDTGGLMGTFCANRAERWCMD